MSEERFQEEAEVSPTNKEKSLSFYAWSNLFFLLIAWEICILYPPTPGQVFYPDLSIKSHVNIIAYILELLMLGALILEVFIPEAVIRAWDKIHHFMTPAKGSMLPPALRKVPRKKLVVGFLVFFVASGAAGFAVGLISSFAGLGVEEFRNLLSAQYLFFLAMYTSASISWVFKDLAPSSTSTLQWGAGFGVTSIVLNTLLLV